MGGDFDVLVPQLKSASPETDADKKNSRSTERARFQSLGRTLTSGSFGKKADRDLCEIFKNIKFEGEKFGNHMVKQATRAISDDGTVDPPGVLKLISDLNQRILILKSVQKPFVVEALGEAVGLSEKGRNYLNASTELQSKIVEWQEKYLK